MKNIIVKYRHAIIALIMIVVNSVGASASTPWTVNASDYRYDMSLYLDVRFAASEMDYSLYDVGVFCGDECRGVAELLPLDNGESCLYVRARSNQESGETMTFKYYDKETEQISDIDGVSFTFESTGRLGYPSDPYVVTIIRHFDVAISAGNEGTVNNNGGRIAEGTELSLTATPNEGYHFEKWSDGSTENPRTIVVNDDVTLAAEFGVNTYNLTYTVDGVEYKSFDVDYGTAITTEANPEKEGYSFSGWSDLPETMPAKDVTVTGTFSINSYNAIFKIGEDVIETKSVVFGQPVVAPEAQAKEGYTFEGWQNVPETMPAHDVEIIGTYTANQYKLTYIVDGASYKEYTVGYGTAITAEANPEKEGYTFSGWSGLPETMPAKDVTVTGTFSINSYKITFKIGDSVIEEKSIKYGEAVTTPNAPEKEGYTFSGWQNVPTSMPANDVEILGSYTINKYRLTIYLNDEIYSTEDVEYGALINVEDPEVPEGHMFDGWSTEIPEVMPAYDLEIYGTYSELNSIASIYIDANENVTVYSMAGVLIFKGKSWAEIEAQLESGLYIINGKKVMIRK